MTRSHRCLPVRTLGQLAVTQQCEYAIISPIDFAGERRSDGEGHSMAQSPGVLLDTIHLSGWMPDEVGTEAIERLQFGRWKKATFGQHAIESFHRVSLALHKSIAIGIAKGPRSDAQDPIIKDVENIDAGEATAGMSCSG